ncbi:MAG: hypothetical protein HQK49_06775 [Oligoflexia bacterium]|nr:hypothetical protein [Oligoflexia bacterium]
MQNLSTSNSKKIFLSLITIFILYSLTWSFLYFFKEMYEHPWGFGMYRGENQLVNKQYPQTLDLLLIGDSRIQAAFNPILYPDYKIINITASGGGPIEAYHIVKKFFQNKNKVKKVIISFASYNYITDYAFIMKSVQYDTLTLLEALQVYWYALINDDLSSLKDVSSNDSSADNKIKNEDSNKKKKFLTFDILKDILLYKTKWPNYYQAELINAQFFNRKNWNIKMTEDTVNKLGYNPYSRFKVNNNPSEESKLKDFIPSKTISIYLQKIITLALQNSSNVIIEQVPWSRTSSNLIPDQYKKNYLNYLQDLQMKFPTLIVNNNEMIYEDDFLADHSHVTEGGTYFYSRYIIETYLPKDAKSQSPTTSSRLPSSGE